MIIGCSQTPRSAPAYQMGLTNSDLQKTAECVLAGIKQKVSDPTITTSVKEEETGKVEEITGTSSADVGELYVIRLTAENDGTKAEAFSVISWSKFKETDLRRLCLAVSPTLTADTRTGGVLRQTHRTRLQNEVRCLLGNPRASVAPSLATLPAPT